MPWLEAIFSHKVNPLASKQKLWHKYNNGKSYKSCSWPLLPGLVHMYYTRSVIASCKHQATMICMALTDHRIHKLGSVDHPQFSFIVIIIIIITHKLPSAAVVFHRIAAGVLVVDLIFGLRTHYTFWLWLGDVREQAIACTKLGLVPWRHMMSLTANRLIRIMFFLDPYCTYILMEIKLLTLLKSFKTFQKLLLHKCSTNYHMIWIIYNCVPHRWQLQHEVWLIKTWVARAQVIHLSSRS